MFEVGRVCMKTAGRESGKYCTVIKKMDEGFVMVTGPKSLTSVKRRRCNINHLEPIEEVVKIKSDASDDEVLKAYQQASIMARLGLEKGKKPKAPKAEKKAERAEPEKRGHKEKAKEPKHKPAHKEKKVKHEKKPAKKPAKKEKTRLKPKKARAGKKTVKKAEKK